jgi:TolB-like protein/Tfp pilus assembly protein PilF
VVDVAEFEQLIGEDTVDSLARAAALYRGDLLDGLDLRDAAFDEWLLMERQHLRDLAREALARVLDQSMAGRARDEAAAAARRLLALDPLRESAHRALMQIYAEQGQTALALKQYQLCRDALQRELGVKPESETERLYRTVQEKRTAARQTPDQAPAAQVAAETGPLPDPPPVKHEPETAAAFAKPLIAVLPFTNLSTDPEQQYFSDGISEDIITELSRFRQLRVFARNASFRYRGQDVDPLRVARELGVAFLVEGSVRRLGDRIRITAQLIDAGTGHHVWAERFDRHQEELFGVQDQVVRTIVGTLVGRLQAAGAERVTRKPPTSLAAYECVLRGDALPFESSEGATEARRLFEKAIKLDPGYARAYALLAAMVHREWLRDMSGSDCLLDQAFEVAKKAVALDQNDDLCHCELAWIYLARHSFELAEHHLLKALELNRNGSVVMASLGLMYVFLGKTAQGMSFLEEAKLLNPLFDPTWYYPFLGAANFIARRHDEAIAALSRSSTMPFWAQAYLAASYAMTDRSTMRGTVRPRLFAWCLISR